MGKYKAAQNCPMWILSLEDSLVRTLACQAGSQASMDRDQAYGQNFTELIMKSSPGISLLRIVRNYLIPGLNISYMTFPKSGMMHNGNVFQLRNLAIGIKEREYSLLPTPMRSDLKGLISSSETLMKYLKRKRQNKLIYQCRFNGLTGTQTLEVYESMMGFPLGWTKIESKQLEIAFTRT